MKNSTIVRSLFCLALGAFSIADASAQRRGRIPRMPGLGIPDLGPAVANGMDLDGLGAMQSQFAEYKTQTNGGAAFYEKGEKSLRAEHVGLYAEITKKVIGDRISQEQGGAFVDRLMLIGQEHKEGDTKTEERLAKLRSELEEASAEKVSPEQRSPRLNKMQWEFEELHRFAEEKEALSGGELSSLRRKLDRIAEKEEKAKEGGELTDRDRKKLIGECQGVWKRLLKDIQD